MPRPRRRAAVWRTLRRLILETGSLQVEALLELEQCDTVAEEMTRYRQAGFNLVEQIDEGSTDAGSRDQARRALLQYSFAEGLLNRIASHLHQGTELVDGAHVATRQAITLASRGGRGVRGRRSFLAVAVNRLLVESPRSLGRGLLF